MRARKSKKVSKHKKALEKIEELVDKYGNGDYIFRGTSMCYSLQRRENRHGKFIYDGINSTLYRWVVKEKKEGSISEEKETLREIFDGYSFFHPARMEKDIVQRAGTMFPGNTQEHEILTDLQHFGGKTNMIDFSRNMHIALFFACKSRFHKKGELLALHQKHLKSIKEVSYEGAHEEGKLEVIDPAGAQSSRQRVHFQGSVFVRPADGFINRELCKRNKIDEDLKKPIMEYLREVHNITDDTIYNDIYGFVNNERNNETASFYFYLGEASLNRKRYQKAIEYYSECLNLAGSSDRVYLAYIGRGQAYYESKDFISAIKDYDEAIIRNNQYGLAYLCRGLAMAKKYGLKEAEADFAKAKELSFAPSEDDIRDINDYWLEKEGE